MGIVIGTVGIVTPPGITTICSVVLVVAEQAQLDTNMVLPPGPGIGVSFLPHPCPDGHIPLHVGGDAELQVLISMTNVVGMKTWNRVVVVVETGWNPAKSHVHFGFMYSPWYVHA